ncbi:hypothetical protein LTR27_003827 [Elasticomyces elasticus]|nr:hypothetical protein LTR27_003827 [Elasticomyces elasticus]
MTHHISTHTTVTTDPRDGIRTLLYLSQRRLSDECQAHSSHLTEAAQARPQHVPHKEHHVQLPAQQPSSPQHLPRKRPPRAACHSAASLAVRSLQPCGACQRAAIEERHTELISDLKAAEPGSWTPSIELVEAEAEWEIQSFHLTRQYPERRFEKFARPEHGQRATPMRIPGPSPLRQEVRPADVPDDAHAWTSGGWDADWGSGWKTMEEELAEQEAEKPEDVKAYEAMKKSDYLAWAEDRPSENFVEGAEIDEQSHEDKEEEEAEADLADVKTAVADIEELPSDVSDTISATREPENVRPAKAITFELRRHPKAMSMRRKASGEYETDEAKWTCFSLWLMVS